MVQLRFVCLLTAATASWAELALEGTLQDAVVYDDECLIAGNPSACAWHALQLRTSKKPGEESDQQDEARAMAVEKPLLERPGSTRKVDVVAATFDGTSGQAKCEGDWCSSLINFCHLFDTNQPRQMQKAFDMYSDYARREEGIKLAVTKDHFYEMYHGNVGQKLSEFLPQKLFAWEFKGDFETVEPSGRTEATVVRTGTVTFNLGYWKRNMFWNSVVKPLPKGQVFPYSTVAKFDDCKKCPAKLVFTLKKGGINGDVAKDWKVTGLSLIKLA